MTDYQCKCGSIDMFTETKGNHIGLYCSMCGKWQKWMNKNELRAFEQSKKLDQIVDKCIERLENATEDDVQRMKEIYRKYQ